MRRKGPVQDPYNSDELALRHARLGIQLNAKVMLGRVSVRFTHGGRAVRFTFLPNSGKARNGIEVVEFELPKVEAWALAEWMTDQTTKRAPGGPSK
jgi:hypothetical protein